MAVPWVWRGRVLSEVIGQVDRDGAAAVESQSLRAELSRLLTDAGVQRLDEAIAGNPFVAQADLQAAGFDVVFDMGLLQLAVNAIDPALRPAEPLLGRDNSSEPQIGRAHV